MPRYMIAIHHPDDYDAATLEDAQMRRDIDVLNDEMVAAGARVFVGGLHRACDAKTMLTQTDGRVSLTDGPYLKTSSHVGGFWVLQAQDMSEALAWGRKAAVACRAPVEVRRFHEPISNRSPAPAMMNPAKNTICLWYNGDAEAAARFYAAIFPDSSVGAVHQAPSDFPSGKKGDIIIVEFTVMGIPCIGLNGGPQFSHNQAFSFQVSTNDQAETDRYWNAIVGNGGQASECGWCKDKWGISWQITPVALIRAITDPDRAAAKRAFDAMARMGKIDIAAIEAARRG